MSSDTVDIYNEKALRATQGSIFKIPFFYGPLDDVVKVLKDNNIKCIGTNLKKAIYVDQLPKGKKYSICFGNEARGMSDLISNLMDVNVIIPMSNKVESLNVLSASSIIMYILK